jgi:hypothetical protein
MACSRTGAGTVLGSDVAGAGAVFAAVSIQKSFSNVPGLWFEGSEQNPTSSGHNSVSAVVYSFSESGRIVDVTLEFAAEK